MGGLEPKYSGPLGYIKNWNHLSMIALVDGRVHGKVEEPFAKSKFSLYWMDKFRQQEQQNTIPSATEGMYPGR